LLGTPASLVVRRATVSELPELHALIESAYRGESAKTGWTHEADLLEGPRTDFATLSAAVSDPEEILLTFWDDNKIVGCVQITRKSSILAYLGLVTVNPNRQANGLGKVILQAAEEEARIRFSSQSIELSVVHKRTELIAYYTRRGYVRTGEERQFPIELDPPLRLVVLAKQLFRS
jgi:N-acetylglutamate synthase-like GNAT family acetyltransferase